MDTFGVVFNEMNKKQGGMQVEVTRQDQNGRLHPARPQELGTLSTKSRIANVATLLQRLTKEEKLQWALDTKDEANVLYRQEKYTEAMEKYVEALTASNFGKKKEDSEASVKLVDEPTTNGKDDATDTSGDNVDTLIVPCLCNLAACCLQLSQWAKTILFAEQVLSLRPNCRKAQYRMGVALFHVGEFAKSLHTLEESLLPMPHPSTGHHEDSSTDRNGTDSLSTPPVSLQQQQLTEKERAKVKYWQSKAADALRKEGEALRKRKQALQKAFASNAPVVVPVANPNPAEDSKTPENASKTVQDDMGFLELVGYLCYFYLHKLFAFIFWLLFPIGLPGQNNNTNKSTADNNHSQQVLNVASTTSTQSAANESETANETVSAESNRDI